MLTRKLASIVAFAELCQRGKGEEARHELRTIVNALHHAHQLAHEMEQSAWPRETPPMPSRWPANVTPFRVRP